METLIINNQDFTHLVSALRVGYETLVSENSGRNAAGNTVIDVINKKVKLYVTLRHTLGAEMQEFLDAIKNYVVTVSFLNPKTNSMQTIRVYTSTPEPEYYTVHGGNVIYKPLNINFIEL